MVSLGRRIGLLAPIFHLGRNALTHERIANRLNALGDPALGTFDPYILSKIFNAAAPDRIDKATYPAKVASTIASLVAEEVKAGGDDLSKRYGPDVEMLREKLLAPSWEFLRYLAAVADPGGSAEEGSGRSNSAGPEQATQHLPVLPVVSDIPRRDAEALYQRLGGKCFLYRLGEEERTTRNGDDEEKKLVPVLRRIPVLIEDTGMSYLTYSDSYSFYQEEPADDWAEGYIFYTKECYTIIASDHDTKSITELFLVQLRENPIRREGPLLAIETDMYQGVMVMSGDLRVPTACKTLLRRAPEACQAMEWKEFARKYELKLDIKEQVDGSFDVYRSKDSKVEFDGLPYSFYATRLHISDHKIDIRVR